MGMFFTFITVLANRLLEEFQAVLQFMYPRGHFRTRRSHLLNIRYFCDFLAEIGVKCIRDIRRGHVARYIGALQRRLHDGEIRQRTAINRLNSVNELLVALFQSERCYFSPKMMFGTCRRVRTRSLTEVTAG